MLGMISIFLNLPRLALWPRMWSILEKVPCALEKGKEEFKFKYWQVSLLRNKDLEMSAVFTRIRWKDKFNTLQISHLHWWVTSNTLQNLSSVQFSCSVMSDSFRPHESQRARPPCPSPTPGVHSDSCPSSQWCHPTVSSSVVPFSFCLQSFPASGVSSSQQVAKVLELQHQSFQWVFRADFL